MSQQLHAVHIRTRTRTASVVFAALAAIASLFLISSSASAAAPVLLGSQTVGPNSDYNPAGWAEAFSSVASSSGTVDSLRVYVDAQSNASSLVAGLYADSGGAPGALIAQGSKATPAAGAWNDVTLVNANVTAGKTYWIAVLGPSGTLYYRDACCSTGTKAYVSSSQNLSTLSTSWSGTATYNAGPISAYAVGKDTKDTGAPSTPGGLSVSGITATSLTMSWNASTDDVGVAGYDALRSGSKVGSTTSTSYAYSGLQCGTSYPLGVDAFDAAGNVSSVANVTATTSACASSGPLLGTQSVGSTADYNPPGWSEAFSTVASGSGTVGGLRVYVDAQSTASSLVAGFYSDVSGAPGSLLGQGTVPAVKGAWNEVPLPNVGVTAGKTYWIAVLAPSGNLYYRDACCASGSKAYVSTSRNLTALPASWAGAQTYNAGPISAYSVAAVAKDTSAPTAPSGLKVTGSAQTSVSLSWTASTDDVGVTGYGVYANSALSGTASGTSYTVGSLTCGTTYTFAADATDAAGNRSAKTSLSAATAACGTTPPPSGATVFVSPTGLDSAACTSAAPCRSFDRAYHVAAAGQAVEVAAGSYPDQNMTADSSKKGPGVVTFRPKSGAAVTVGNIYVGGASYVTFSGMTVTKRLIVENTNYAAAGSTNVTWESMKAQTLEVVGRVSNVTIRGGSFGNTVNSQPQVKKYNQSDPNSAQPTNVVVEDSVFDGFRRSNSSVHTECFQVLNANGLTLRRNKFSNCDGTGNLGLTCEPGTTGITVENNWIMGGGDTGYGAQISGDCQNLVFRYNSSTQDVFFADSSNAPPYTFVGNYMPYHSGLCKSGASFSRNLFEGGKCGSSDLSVGSLDFAGAFDLHLKAGANAIDKGDPGSYPSTDIDGQGRPRGAAPDAGSDES